MTAVAVGSLGDDPFFTNPFGADVPGLVPAFDGGVRPGNLPGLYGGTRNKKACDKAALTAFLTDPANTQKASAWAGVRKMPIKGIRAYIQRLTPVILRSDTRVRNHGFREGIATVLEVLLEAGIAVLVDEFGEPVVKCNCGNPLSPPLERVTEFDVDLPDDRWERRYDRKKVTTVKPDRRQRIRRFHLVDLITGKGIGRPAGTDANRDAHLPTPANPPPPASGQPTAAASIMGNWRPEYDIPTAAEVKVTRSGDETFSGTFAKDVKLTDSCTLPAGGGLWRLNGSGARYTGTITIYTVEAAGCTPSKEVQARWDVTGSDTLRLCLDLGDKEQCETWRRAS
ncbi:DUF6777 domain-containing protein [Nonomuraea sp. NPDC050540]|uniref:DUF6777 domain-containing protein n=1 Tax=Nonomuraea sp. NPDC050540 TaxID=3364367 RepID=UPI0037A8D537